MKSIIIGLDRKILCKYHVLSEKSWISVFKMNSFIIRTMFMIKQLFTWTLYIESNLRISVKYYKFQTNTFVIIVFKMYFTTLYPYSLNIFSLIKFTRFVYFIVAVHGRRLRLFKKLINLNKIYWLFEIFFIKVQT